ncbi:hypothetical protein ACM40_19515 [Chryseobacterium sp. BLS98]|uniref:hypothetical protein n=1 Tax=Chryseobacterium sp. BLS98 TaxID=885586 RepID=UPI00065AA743|nr:hypothetical protein [Chryseobacterium sp. BLS98]KMQ59127.1 hypothetical protein ACM40_19515 [Chryseobacterium sp. BLS98]
MNLDKQWWENFTQTNQNFRKTCVINNVLSAEEVEDLTNAINEALLEKLKSGEKGGFRLYFPEENAAKVNNKYKDKMFTDHPQPGETLQEYFKRSFGQKFGIIFNAAERYSPYIAEKLMMFTKPLIDAIGLPAAGMHATVFIGDYGWTPLGIHQDHKGANVIHFHLGPGEKTMYTWEENKYKELTGGKQNNHDITPLLEEAEVYTFGTGDLYYMPWDQFHIGKNDEYSIGITFWFNNPTKATYFDNVMNTFYTQYIDDNNEEVINPQKEYAENPTTFDDVMGLFKSDEIMSMSVKDFFQRIHSDYKYSLISNHGWENTPQTRKQLDQYEIDDYDHLKSKTIKAPQPFKIIYDNSNEDSFVFFVRGYKMEIRKSNFLPEIIDKINSFQHINTEDLLANINSEWPEEAGLYFLSMIYDKRGFDVIH